MNSVGREDSWRLDAEDNGQLSVKVPQQGSVNVFFWHLQPKFLRRG